MPGTKNSASASDADFSTRNAARFAPLRLVTGPNSEVALRPLSVLWLLYDNAIYASKPLHSATKRDGSGDTNAIQGGW